MITTLIAVAAIGSSHGLPLQNHRLKTVAVLPWTFRAGTPSAVETANDTINHFFDRAGYDRLSPDRIGTVWHHQSDWVNMEQDPMPPMPTDQQLKRIGQRLGVDLICVGRVSWHTRSVWVSLGPKTKATCTIDLRMVAIDHGGVSLNERDVQADDTSEESGFQTAAGILTGGLVTVVSGGPASSHQQRAAQIALSRAFEPWLEGAIGR